MMLRRARMNEEQFQTEVCKGYDSFSVNEIKIWEEGDKWHKRGKWIFLFIKWQCCYEKVYIGIFCGCI